MALLIVVSASYGAPQLTLGEASTKSPVGQLGTNRWYTPANQILTPAGIQVELPGMRPQALALSPQHAEANYLRKHLGEMATPHKPGF